MTSLPGTPFTVNLLFGLAILALVAILFFCLNAFLNKKFGSRLLALKQKEALELERGRIAADIHDDIGAELTSISILAQLLKRAIVSDQDGALQLAQKIEDSSNQVIIKLNEVIWTLNTKDHTLKHLMARARSYVATLRESTHAAIGIHICTSALIDYPLIATFTRNVFLIIKEMLQNAVKHSRAGNITLTISLLEMYWLRIEYADDGVGFNQEQVKAGMGLGNIKQRVMASSGTLQFLPAAGTGCRIHIIVPINDPGHEQ